jgi:hypothetical protein
MIPHERAPSFEGVARHTLCVGVSPPFGEGVPLAMLGKASGQPFPACGDIRACLFCGFPCHSPFV